MNRASEAEGTAVPTPRLQLGDMTWIEAADALKQRPVGLLPVGAIEAHGPHLPLDTDIIIAAATARRSAERLLEKNVPSLVLPPVAYTVSFVGTSFPGTSPVEASAFEVYLTSILRNLGGQGYRALIVCNAHLEPAHVACIREACIQSEATAGIPIRSPDQRSPELAQTLSPEFQAGARHAGAYETSIVMAEEPAAVRDHLLAGLDPVWIDLPARLREGAGTFAGAGATMGYFGDPKRASIEEGRQMLDALATMVLDVCRGAGLIPAE